ncbi:MAG TPA: lactonase family protein, partial [Chitinophagaceae bacterium]
IYVYRFNSASGKSTLLSSTATSNPSYLAVSPNQHFVYAVNENHNDSGAVTAFSFSHKTGSLRKLDTQLTMGDDPCYVSIDKTGKWAFTANYSGGNFSVFPVNADGSLKAATTTIADHGSGVNKERQEKAHVHSTVLSPDNKYVFVSDLGIDKIMTWSLNPVTGKLKPAAQPYTELVPGSGPRHLVFAPSGKYAYLMQELSGHVIVFRYNDGHLKQLQDIASVPASFHGFAGSADIHVSPDGKFVYGSNRGESNTIVIYAVNPATGMLTVKGFEPVLGKAPRNFNFDPSGNFLLVANQDTDEVVIFKRNKQTGLLKDTGERIKAGNPVCIKWIN